MFETAVGGPTGTEYHNLCFPFVEIPEILSYSGWLRVTQSAWILSKHFHSFTFDFIHMYYCILERDCLVPGETKTTSIIKMM